MLKAVIMDFDGLIVDTESETYNVFREWILQHHGYDLQKEEYLTCVGSNDKKLLDFLKNKGVEIDEKIFVEEMSKILPYRCKHLLAREGVVKFIKSVKNNGLKLALATSSKAPKAENHLKQLGLFSYFDIIITADDVQNVKPAPDLFIKALDQLDVQCHEAIVIEDSQNGVIASNNAQIPVIVIPNDITKLKPFIHHYKKFDSLEVVDIESIINDFV